MTNNRKAMLSKHINRAESCLEYAKGDKYLRLNQYSFLNKGSNITKEDYKLAIHNIKNKISYMRRAITSYEDTLKILESLSK